MEEMIETRVSPETVWQAWERAHVAHGQTKIESGQKGKNKFRYEVLDVKMGESFSISWKTLFVRIVFSHLVQKTKKGSKIQYKVQIKGLFAWPVRWLLRDKIQKNIRSVLKAVVTELEDQAVR